MTSIEDLFEVERALRAAAIAYADIKNENNRAVLRAASVAYAEAVRLDSFRKPRKQAAP